ncbi:spore coat protein [Bacillus sp. 31A1R]|uniref:Spore coat protein n=2 Tax=Robertmurraya mangrovi TaxID=3098077 RepID=A0ABU5J3J3_9BACI|nr:spore coat protein [Bacillus sp. 31A1R]MDZ5473984.1 spore coat protein [Bacillus sp. 31A1R]
MQTAGTNNMMGSGSIASPVNHGAHEVLDVHEVLSGTLGALNSYLMFEQQIKDPELMDILNRQRQFITDQYNVLVECFKTGQDPSHPTTSYMMNQSNDVIYGLKPSQPTKPNQQASEIGDKCISSLMLSCMKTTASSMTMTAGEATNPIVRRVLQDSIPNYLEMAYEIFLYQNKHKYYQVPQLKEQDMQQMINAYAPANGTQGMNPQSNMIQ